MFGTVYPGDMSTDLLILSAIAVLIMGVVLTASAQGG